MYVEETLIKRNLADRDNSQYVTFNQWELSLDPAQDPHIVSSGPLPVRVDVRRSSGWDIPDYHKRVSRGDLLPQTPWSDFTCEGTSTGDYSVTFHAPCTGSPSSTVSYWIEPYYPHMTDWIITEEELKAQHVTHDLYYVQMAAAKIRAKSYDALTAIAELTQVRRMFTSLATRLYKLILSDKTFKRSMRTRYASDIRDVTGSWLSMRYGWRTLIYDIASLNDVIKNFDNKRKRHAEKSGSLQESTTTAVTYEDNGAWITRVVVTEKISVYHRGSVVADIEVPQFQFNLLDTAWELVPFSFVVDWFLSIGKALSAISFLAYNERYSASSGTKVTMEREYSRSVESENDNCPYYVMNGLTYWQTGNCKATLVDRLPCHVPLLPSATFKLNVWKGLDLLALLIQKI